MIGESTIKIQSAIDVLQDMYHRPHDFGGGAEDVHHGMYLVVLIQPLPIPPRSQGRLHYHVNFQVQPLPTSGNGHVKSVGTFESLPGCAGKLPDCCFPSRACETSTREAHAF